MEKLAFIMDSLCFGGSETQTIELVNSLAEMNYEILLFSMDSVDTLKERIHPSVEVVILKKKSYLDIGCLRRIISELKKFQPHAMFFINTYSMLYGYLAGFFLPVIPKKIIVQHSTFLETMLDRTKNILYKRIMNRMDRIVFVSNNQKTYWIKKYHIDLAKSVVIYNGVDIRKFENHRVDKAAFLGRLGFLPSDIIIGIIARITPEKRHEDLVDGVDLLVKDGYPVKLLIVGDGVRRGYIEDHIRARGIGDKVHITGFVEDVRDFLACMDISVLASSTEGLSMAVIESMAMSKPIVLTDVGGARELVRSFENGIVYEPGSVKELYRSLKYVIDYKLFDLMGRESLFKVKTTFLKEDMIQNYLNLLNS